MSNEQDARMKLLDSILETPHRDIKAFHALHKSILGTDPELYGRLAAWYWNNGDVRDHHDLFTAMLISSSYEGHRAAGLHYLRKLEPYRVSRVVSFYEQNINKSKPEALRTELKYFWWEIEANRSRLDGALMYSKKDMRHLVKFNKIPHSDYSDRILFRDDPPEDSVFNVIKKISRETNPTEQARLILENKIPFRQAESLIKKITPAALVAIVQGMSPQDVINNMKTLEKRGALANADLKALINKKLEDGKGNKRVSALKVKDAKKATSLSQEQTKILDDLADSQVKSKGRISVDTALLVDKSGSLAIAIETAKQLGVLVSSVMTDEAQLHVVAFDGLPRPITVKGKTLADWEKAFESVIAQGNTSCGAGIAWLTKQKTRVEQIIIITDEDENTGPTFIQAYQEYVKTVGVSPHVVIVRVGSWKTTVENACKKAGVAVDTYEIGRSADKYSFPNIIRLLSRKSKFDLLMEVIGEPLPERSKPVPMPQSVRARWHQLKKA